MVRLTDFLQAEDTFKRDSIQSNSGPVNLPQSIKTPVSADIKGMIKEYKKGRQILS